MTKNANDKQQATFDEKVIQVSRVSKKTKGGNQIGFSVLMVVGDKKGRVGVGLGKAPDVLSAIKKGVKRAKKRMIEVPLDGTTIPFPIEVKKGAGQILLKPSPKGSGVIAGGPVRAVVEAAGVRDISGKILGTENQASNVYATFEALHRIKRLVKIKNIKLRSIAQIEAEEAAKQEALQAKHKKKATLKQESADKEPVSSAKAGTAKSKSSAKKTKKAVKPKAQSKAKSSVKPKAKPKTKAKTK